MNKILFSCKWYLITTKDLPTIVHFTTGIGKLQPACSFLVRNIHFKNNYFKDIVIKITVKLIIQ